MRLMRRIIAGAAGVALIGGATMLAVPATAAAATQEGLGYDVTPAQPYLHNPDKADWLGSYVVNGKQVWCIRFAFKAPDSNEKYHNGDALATKWGEPLSAEQNSEVSYLLLRYGNTKSADEAAALAHILHDLTAGVSKGDPRLDPKNDFRHIAYDVDYHLSKLPASAQQAVSKLRADAQANHGPWKVTLTAPEDKQTIGTKGEWKLQVTNAAGKGVGGVPVALSGTDATVADTVTTPADGSPLNVDVTPTGQNPTVNVSLSAPAETPKVLVPDAGQDTQYVVTTGGETKLTATAKTTATTAPGSVKVTKLDTDSNNPISGAQIEVTAANKTDPAVKQDGSPLTGQDGKPIVLTTGNDGTATVDGLKTPQDICVVEVKPAPGYEQTFDSKNPPSACGTVKPGETLALSLTNKKNTPPTTVTVPVKIPAGGDPGALATSASVHSQIEPGALLGFGALVLAGLSAIAYLWRRRSVSGR